MATTKQLTHTAAQVDDAAEKRHQHQNMSALNAITASKTQAWDGKQDKIEAGTGISIAADGKTISATGGLSLGETATTAYRGDRGKTAYEHTSSTNNPHGVTKAQVGLGNVDNTSDQNKPVSIATQEALDEKQDKLIAGSGIVIGSDGKTISSTGGGGTGGANWGEIGGNIQSQADLVSALEGKADSSHTHAIANVNGLQTVLDGKQGKLTNTDAQIQSAVSASHSHSNKSVLDGLTSQKVTSWDNKQGALTFDTVPTAGSSNPVTSGGIKTALDGKANSSHSHSISNITGLETALDGKMPNKSIDESPTSGSNNLVTSGGVYSALQNLPAPSVPCYNINCHESSGSYILDSQDEVDALAEALDGLVTAPAGSADIPGMLISLQPSSSSTQVWWMFCSEVIRESASSNVFHIIFRSKKTGYRGTFDLTVNVQSSTASLSFSKETTLLTEAQYNALSVKDPETVYYITD